MKTETQRTLLNGAKKELKKVKEFYPVATIQTIEEIIKSFENGSIRILTLNYEAKKFFKNCGFQATSLKFNNYLITY